MKRSDWIPVKTAKPKCPRSQNSLGTLVLILTRCPKGSSVSGFAYYGRRATGKPAFYLFGAEIFGVTHWMPMPDGPKEERTKP